jgi:hypothetical protein
MGVMDRILESIAKPTLMVSALLKGRSWPCATESGKAIPILEDSAGSRLSASGRADFNEEEGEMPAARTTGVPEIYIVAKVTNGGS